MSGTVVPPVNVLIWMAVKPVIKLVLPAAGGFLLTKNGLFPVAGSRSASQIILNITLPALLFSKIIPSFTKENVGAIGPIFLAAFIYIGISGLLGLLIRTFLPVPPNFRYGILAASMWSNWGDLPTSSVSSVTLSAPFKGQADSDLAIAYVSIFILVFYITLFPMRGTLLIERDYTHPPKEADDEEAYNVTHWRKIRSAGRGLSTAIRRRGKTRRGDGVSVDVADEKEDAKEEGTPRLGMADPSSTDLRRQTTTRSIGSASVRELAGTAAAAVVEDTSHHNRKLSFGRQQLRMAQMERERLKTIVASPAGSVFDDDGETTAVASELEGRERAKLGGLSSGGLMGRSPSVAEELRAAGEVEEEDARRKELSPGTSGQEVEQREQRPKSKAWKIAVGVKNFLSSLATPPTISLVTALVCALVDPLKALFTSVEGRTPYRTIDGNPPLSIILDTAAFMGSASVPLGLFVLGSALARMRLPRPLSRLPYASIIALALAKLVVLPLFGYFFVDALTKHTSLVDEDDYVLRFVMTYFSVVPTATTQVALTQIFAPEDGESNSDVLASYLIVQYSVFAISSVVLTAFTLRNIFQ